MIKKLYNYKKANTRSAEPTVLNQMVLNQTEDTYLKFKNPTNPLLGRPQKTARIDQSNRTKGRLSKLNT